MTQIEIDGDALTVKVEGLDELWAFKSELRVVLAHIAGVTPAEDEARQWWHGFRAPGVNLPGVITAGTFYNHGGRVFWDVHRPERAIAIALHDERYTKLIIEVEDPAADIARIQAALSARPTA